MVTSTHGADLSDEDIDLRLRWANVDCVDPDSIDQADLLAFSEGPVLADIAQRCQAHLDVCEYCGALSVEYRRMAGERRRKRHFLHVAGAASIAAAAGILAAIMIESGRPPEQTVREYELAILHGTIARTMAAPATAEIPEEPWHFAPTSPIELVLRPRAEDAPGITPTAAIYQSARGGRLSRVSKLRVEAGSDDGYPLLSISTTGANVFGENAGERTLIIVLAPDAAALERIEGKTIEEAKALLSRDAQIFDYDVVYEN